MERVHEEVCSIAHAGLSVINAIPSGTGSTVAISLGAEACVWPGSHEDHGALVEAVIRYFSNKTGMDYRITIDSEIPQGSGLKSSSAVTVAAIASLSRITGIDVYPPALSSEISRNTGVSVTGAFDDAVSAYHGGCFLTDNYSMKIHKRLDFPDDIVFVISVAGMRAAERIHSLAELRDAYGRIVDLASRGEVLQAMDLNGHMVAAKLGYDMDYIARIDRTHPLASGVSGNGPAIFAAFRNGDEGPALDLMSDAGKVIVARAVGYESNR